MTTPRVPRPGEVKALTDWASFAVPDDLKLPNWIPRQEFLRWLSAVGEAFAYAETVRAQNTELARQRRHDDARWLKDALKGLETGETARLIHRGQMQMPGDTRVECWLRARDMGDDFDELVQRRDVDKLRAVVGAALSRIEARTRNGRAGRPKAPAHRDTLLTAVFDKLMTYTISGWPDGPDGIEHRPPRAAEAKLEANAILIRLGIEAASWEKNVGSVGRAIRRGRGRPQSG